MPIICWRVGGLVVGQPHPTDDKNKHGTAGITVAIRGNVLTPQPKFQRCYNGHFDLFDQYACRNQKCERPFRPCSQRSWRLVTPHRKPYLLQKGERASGAGIDCPCRPAPGASTYHLAGPASSDHLPHAFRRGMPHEINPEHATARAPGAISVISLVRIANPASRTQKYFALCQKARRRHSMVQPQRAAVRAKPLWPITLGEACSRGARLPTLMLKPRRRENLPQNATRH